MEILDQVLVKFFHTGGREILSGCFSGSTHVIFLEKVPFLESKGDDGLHKWVA